MDRRDIDPSFPSQVTTSLSSAASASMTFIDSAGTLSPLSSTLAISAASPTRKTSASITYSVPAENIGSFPFAEPIVPVNDRLSRENNS